MSTEGKKHKSIKKSFKIKNIKGKLKYLLRFFRTCLIIGIVYNIGFYLSKKFFTNDLAMFSQIMFGLGMIMICFLAPFIVRNYEEKEKTNKE